MAARRTFPHPYHYLVVTPQETVEITADDVVTLLQEKRIVAPHASEWGDGYNYRVVDLVYVRDRALKNFAFGFGRCPVCTAAPIGLTQKGVAARHGHTKDTPPCAGSGKPLHAVITRESFAVRAAA